MSSAGRTGPRSDATPRAVSVADRNAALATHLIAHLAAHGVRDAIVSPGSRNTPLVLALDGSSAVRSRVVLDERAAGFVALGMARAARRPVALVCTSGSAGAHYLPAAIEARYGRVALLLITADRPPELQGCAAPQTIDQARLFGDFVRHTAHLDPDTFAAAGEAWLRRVVAQAVGAAAQPVPGPVHFNVRFREPLWDPQVDYRAPEDVRPARIVAAGGAAAQPVIEEVAAELGAGRRGVIACGPRTWAPPDDLRTPMLELAGRLGWPVLADPLSGIRFGARSNDLITTYDLLLRDPHLAERLRPDRVLWVGLPPTSKSLAGWLERQAGARMVIVDEAGEWLEPAGVADTVITGSPAAICAQLADRFALRGGATSTDAGWVTAWRRAEAAAREALEGATAGELWEGSVARAVLAALPDGATLHVGSSKPVRDLDGYTAAIGTPGLVVGNRGANGIDGGIASATGAALARGGPTVVLSGELAALHDAGGLLTAGELDVPLTIVVIDNGGGGIFRTLPIASHPTAFERFFLTPQRAALDRLTAAAGGVHTRVHTLDELRAALAEAIPAPRLDVIQVRVDPIADQRRRDAALQAVRGATSREGSAL